MSDKIQTVAHTFNFDTNKPEGQAAWESFKEERKGWPRCHGPVFSEDSFRGGIDEKTVTLETDRLFNNQWNSDFGRVFDFTLQTDSSPWAKGSAPRGIRRGYYLEQTEAMREIRRNTNACGYCGHQESAARGAVFCGKCLGSPYLKTEDLHLLRMRAIDDDTIRAELTEAELSYLLPLYKVEQLKLNKAKGEKARAAVLEKVRIAEMERDGIFWLTERGISVENVIFYSTSFGVGRGYFCFGWRDKGVSEEVASQILEFISEFPFPYKIQIAGGRTLEGY